MENKIVIASHGKLAQGMLDTIHFIAGAQEHVEALCLYEDHTIDYEAVAENKLKEYCGDYNVIVLTDIIGGSVNLLFVKLLERYSFHLISSFTLGVILEMSVRNEMLTEDVIEEILNAPQVHPVYLNHVVRELKEEVYQECLSGEKEE